MRRHVTMVVFGVCLAAAGLTAAGLAGRPASRESGIFDQPPAVASPGGRGGFPTWHEILPAASRFRLVMGNHGVLDRETGLVWERSPGTAAVGWVNASFYCYGRAVGGRKGWRLPTVEELMSLVDPGATTPALPGGHPFSDIQNDVYWSATTIAGITGSAYGVFMNDGALFDQTKATLSLVWCVRGGHGHDGF